MKSKEIRKIKVTGPAYPNIQAANAIEANINIGLIELTTEF